MGITLRENPAGLAEALAAEPMRIALGVKMEQARVYAVHIAPVRTGRYAYGAIVLHSRNDPTGERRRRAGGNLERLPEHLKGFGRGGGFHVTTGVRNGKAFAQLTNTTPYAIYLEFGTRYMRAQRILGRAADALKK